MLKYPLRLIGKVKHCFNCPGMNSVQFNKSCFCTMFWQKHCSMLSSWPVLVRLSVNTLLYLTVACFALILPVHSWLHISALHLIWYVEFHEFQAGSLTMIYLFAINVTRRASWFSRNNNLEFKGEMCNFCALASPNGNAKIMILSSAVTES